MFKSVSFIRNKIKVAIFPGSKLRFINWYLQHECDLKCSYCKVPIHRTKVMAVEERRKALKSLYTLCHPQSILTIIGGEPTLRPHFLIDAVHDATQIGFTVQLVSNGWGLNPEIIEGLGRAGLRQLTISVDCNSGAEKTNLPKALNLLYFARQNGILPFIGTVITDQTDKHRFRQFAETVIKQGYFISPMACSPEVPGGSFSNAFESDVPTRRLMFEIVPWLLWKKMTTGLVWGSYVYLRTLLNSGSDKSDKLRLWHCSSRFRGGFWKHGRGYLTMDSDGHIGPCQEFPRVFNLLENLSEPISLQTLEQLFNPITRNCPGCLYNCYVTEEKISGPNILVEIPTTIQLMNVIGWASDFLQTHELRGNETLPSQ